MEASIRSRKDLQTALYEFELWLDKMAGAVSALDAETDNIQSVKDAQKRRVWLEKEKVC